jgi:hypothetical protein
LTISQTIAATYANSKVRHAWNEKTRCQLITKLYKHMSRSTVSTSVWSLTIVAIALGFVASFMEQSLVGLNSGDFFLGGVVLGVLFVGSLLKDIERPEIPPPPCPPVCPWACLVALVTFILGLIAAFMGGELFGVSTSEWFYISIAFGLLCTGGHLYRLLQPAS